MTLKKVYEGLDQVALDDTFHLGYYEVDFQDGALRFELHVRFCQDENCPCDALQVQWVAEETVFHTWYDQKRQWLDHQRQPLPDEMVNVFRIVERTETFQERIQHLLFLRRRMVLEQSNRADADFQVHLPSKVMMDGADPDQGVMGKLRLQSATGKTQSHGFGLEFCGDDKCYCDNIFFVLPERNETFIIDSENQWSPTEERPESVKLMTGLRKRAMSLDAFKTLLGSVRAERQLHNYHRFVKAYPKKKREQPIS